MQYNSRAGAYKIVESTASESLYGQVTIFNESAQDISETFKFELNGFSIVEPNGGPATHTVNCPPGQKRTILLHRKGDSGGSFAFKAGMSNAGAASPSKKNMMMPAARAPGVRPPPKNLLKATGASSSSPKNVINKRTAGAPLAGAQARAGIPPGGRGGMPIIQKPGGGSVDQIVAKIKKSKFLRPKPVEKGKKVFLTEYTEGEHVYFLFVNEEESLNMKARYEFQVDGWALVDESAPNVWEFELQAGEQIVK